MQEPNPPRNLTTDRREGAHCVSLSRAADILELRDAAWLQERRRRSNSRSIFAGATRTRSNAGLPPTRWESGLDEAEAFLEIVAVTKSSSARGKKRALTNATNYTDVP